jgi:hypothetical protein
MWRMFMKDSEPEMEIKLKPPQFEIKMKPPKFVSVFEYQKWRNQFISYAKQTDASISTSIINGYCHPYHFHNGEGKPKSILSFTREETILYDRECKALSLLEKCFTPEMLQGFKDYKTAQELWIAIQEMCEQYVEVRVIGDSVDETVKESTSSSIPEVKSNPVIVQSDKSDDVVQEVSGNDSDDFKDANTELSDDNVTP